MGLSGIAFLMAFALGCILALARHPIWGLVTYVGVFYVHPPSRWWGVGVPQLRWSLIASGITLLAVLMSKTHKEQLKPALHSKLVLGFVLFIAWTIIQSMWALNSDMHAELIGLMVKYTLLVVLMYACVDSEDSLRLFLWSHVAGCFYLGWIAYTDYQGGRFEGFGGPNINEANAGALQIVTGVFVAGALFLYSRWRERLVLLAMIPFMVNGLVTTVSRSAFLAAAAGGLIFNYYVPKRFRTPTRVLSVLGIVAFMMLTNPMYWARMNSITYTGEEVEGVDTGAGRLVLINAQWQMFLRYPLGCGHRCTASLSQEYLPDSDLTGEEGHRARSSHSTVMTMLVEHGIPGAFFYIAQVLWVWTVARALARSPKVLESPFLSVVLPAAVAAIVAVLIQDEFVDDLRLEVRFWFMCVLMLMLKRTLEPIEKKVPGEAQPAVPTRAARAAIARAKRMG